MINSFETGGSERQFAALARALDPGSFNLHLGCIRPGGALPDGLGEVPRFPLGGSLYGLQSLRARFRLARQLRRQEIGVAHSFDFYTNLTLIPAALVARVPVVIGSHRQIGDLLTSSQFRAQLAMFRCCHAVVCNSHAAAARLLEHGFSSHKVVVIGNGLPPEAFAEARPAFPRVAGLLRVGMIARMNARYKNHSGFLRAAAQLRGKFPRLEFLLVGDGPLRSELEREAEALGMRDQVIFLGDRQDITAILASLDVSVLTSSSESLSNVILESMAAGIPVVAHAVGGNSELVMPGRGILVADQQEGALASAIEGLLRDAALRAELGRNGKQFAEMGFGLASVRDRYQALYTELLDKQGWRPALLRPPRTASARHDELKIAIIAPTFRYVGGQAVQAELLLRLWRDDPDIEVRFIPVDPPFPGALAWAERVPVLRTLIREPFYVAGLWRGLKHVDIAHIFSASYWSFLLAPVPALLVASLRGKKTLINYRSGEARDHLQRFRMTRFFLQKADRLVVPSGYLINVFRDFGLKAQAVPNIVDTSQFSFRLRQPLRPHLVCTRGFHPYYCIDVVVRAFEEVQRAFPDARLDLVGAGPLEAEIRKQVKKLRLSNVHLMGVASRKEIGRFYDQADIFVNASRLDNMPVSILEAFASGTPVVSSAPEGIRYIVEHERTGLLSESGDAEALARNIIRLLRDPELASRLASNALEEVERYGWTSVREQWLAVYRSLGSGVQESAREHVTVA
jgi:glycosyltransferase involved in cell wall biosynthesis